MKGKSALAGANSTKNEVLVLEKVLVKFQGFNSSEMIRKSSVSSAISSAIRSE